MINYEHQSDKRINETGSPQIKVLLYSEGMKYIEKSGVGKVISHQKKALELNNIPFTTDEKDNYSLVHINTVGLKSLKLAKNARKNRIPVILNAHTTEEDFKNSFIFSNAIAPFLRKWLTRFYRKADLIITPTAYSKEVLEKYNLGVKIIALSNGVDEKSFKKDELLGEKFRKHYRLSNDDKLIVSVGLKIKRKGILDFIEVAKKLPDYKFFWVGHTPQVLIPRNVRNSIKSAPSNVYFTGFISQDLLKGAYSGADLFFLPSYEENEGIVVLEALAAGQRVLLRDIGVYKTWLSNGVNCFKGSDNEEFQQLIKEVIIDGRGSDFYGNSRSIIEDRSLSNIGAKLKEIYLELIEDVSKEHGTINSRNIGK